MKITRRIVSLGLGAMGAGAVAGSAHAEGFFEELAGDAEDFRAAFEAYVYGYPLVTMEMTRRIMTNVASVEATRALMGQFVRLRAYPDASYRDVTAPNADTSTPPSGSMSARSRGSSAFPT
jgi:hypothetical protein